MMTDAERSQADFEEQQTKKRTYLLSLEGSSEAEANRYAAELQNVLLRIHRLRETPAEISVQRRRDNLLTLDLGSTLVLVLGAPAVVAAVNAIGNWLQKRRNASLTIMTSEKGEKKVVAEGITHKEAAHLLELFLIQSAEQKEIDE